MKYRIVKDGFGLHHAQCAAMFAAADSQTVCGWDFCAIDGFPYVELDWAKDRLHRHIEAERQAAIDRAKPLEVVYETDDGEE